MVTRLDWHISCDKQKKICILYEDKEEKFNTKDKTDLS
jgi:hypothetical protein